MEFMKRRRAPDLHLVFAGSPLEPANKSVLVFEEIKLMVTIATRDVTRIILKTPLLYYGVTTHKSTSSG